MEDKNIHIALVDDDTLIIQLLTAFLEEQENIKVVLTAKSGNSFLEKLEREEKTLDIVLLDFRMEDGNGLETIDKLTVRYPQLKIIVLSSYYKASSIGYMLKLGVHAFLPKETDKEDLIDAIQEVNHKDHYFTTEQVSVLRNQISHKTPKQYANTKDTLSSRELDVLQLICQQLTTKQIAERLFVTAKTVEVYKSNLLLKTGVKNTAGLIIYVIQNQLVDANDIVLLE
ncbi:response regulator transcription factor [Tenacibaculum ovolyticum]|uniref:response regulator transcription factor n=1 Tax=Tenacibaculum ovolyticum TaxID=104270 RepID=UPI0022F3C6ED|nr:response regulator transcription factor [Tenacibaculum ovolyticum]WBX76246.1 response regulator transcription factor [Tenacibaculum ovolyticum]